MGTTQSKRLKITSTDPKKDVIEEGAGKLEKIEDIDQLKPQVNGDTGHNETAENAVSEKEKTADTENEKDLSTEKEERKDTDEAEKKTTEAAEEGGAGGDSGTVEPAKPVENGNNDETLDESKVSTVEETAASPANETNDDSSKKPKKEKVKKKWSLRNLSFGRKDKQKPPKKDETTPVNGECEKVPEEATEDQAATTPTAAAGAATDATTPNESEPKAVEDDAATKPVTNEADNKTEATVEAVPAPSETESAAPSSPSPAPVAVETETAPAATPAEIKMNGVSEHIEDGVAEPTIPVPAVENNANNEDKPNVDSVAEVQNDVVAAPIKNKIEVKDENVREPNSDILNQNQNQNQNQKQNQNQNQNQIQNETEKNDANDKNVQIEQQQIDAVTELSKVVVKSDDGDSESAQNQVPPPLPFNPPPSQVMVFALGDIKDTYTQAQDMQQGQEQEQQTQEQPIPVEIPSVVELLPPTPSAADSVQATTTEEKFSTDESIDVIPEPIENISLASPQMGLTEEKMIPSVEETVAPVQEIVGEASAPAAVDIAVSSAKLPEEIEKKIDIVTDDLPPPPPLPPQLEAGDTVPTPTESVQAVSNDSLPVNNEKINEDLSIEKEKTIILMDKVEEDVRIVPEELPQEPKDYQQPPPPTAEESDSFKTATIESAEVPKKPEESQPESVAEPELEVLTTNSEIQSQKTPQSPSVAEESASQPTQEKVGESISTTTCQSENQSSLQTNDSINKSIDESIVENVATALLLSSNQPLIIPQENISISSSKPPSAPEMQSSSESDHVPPRPEIENEPQIDPKSLPEVVNVVDIVEISNIPPTADTANCNEIIPEKKSEKSDQIVIESEAPHVDTLDDPNMSADDKSVNISKMQIIYENIEQENEQVDHVTASLIAAEAATTAMTAVAAAAVAAAKETSTNVADTNSNTVEKCANKLSTENTIIDGGDTKDSLIDVMSERAAQIVEQQLQLQQQQQQQQQQTATNCKENGIGENHETSATESLNGQVEHKTVEEIKAEKIELIQESSAEPVTVAE